MRRAVLLLMSAVLLAVSCTSTPASTGAGSPSRTIDIKRTRLDIVYSAFVDEDVHHVTSKKALEAALESVKAAVRAGGGKDDIPTPQFQDVDEPQTADFNKFADAVSELAGRSQLSSERIANAALVGMLGRSPDCHTYYVAPGGGGIQSRPFTPKGSSAIFPAQGTSLGGPDEAGLTGKVLPGGIVYITFRDWIMTGTYHLDETVRAMLDKAVGLGAKAWLFDLRGNPGGYLVDFASFFLNGEPTRTRVVKTGNAGTSTSNTDLRLPEAYQLPIAIIANDRSASASEHFILDLKEGKRATLLGQKTYGCLGAAIETRLPDGGLLSVVVEEVIGGTSGARYNNIGIEPDVQADDATAVPKAIEILNQKIAER